MSNGVETVFVDAVLNKSFCIYAQGAVMQYAEDFITPKNMDLLNVYAHFSRFDAEAQPGKYDAFVIGFSFPHKSADHVVGFGAEILFRMLSMDKGHDFAVQHIGNAGESDWWYLLGSTRYFVLCFSSLYAPESPRHVDRADTSFLMFQPVHSFDRKATPLGGAISEENRMRIRENHRRNGKGYDSFTQSTHEGQKIFHGLATKDNQKWWEIAITKTIQ